MKYTIDDKKSIGNKIQKLSKEKIIEVFKIMSKDPNAAYNFTDVCYFNLEPLSDETLDKVSLFIKKNK